jgi:hypothetical protein
MMTFERLALWIALYHVRWTSAIDFVHSYDCVEERLAEILRLVTLIEFDSVVDQPSSLGELAMALSVSGSTYVSHQVRKHAEHAKFIITRKPDRNRLWKPQSAQ